MASYTGGSKAASRIQALQAQRKTQQERLNQRKQQIVTASSTPVSNSFQSRSDTHHDLLQTDAIGLVTHTDFKARRKQLQNRDAATSAQVSTPAPPRKRPPVKRAVLSFAADSDDSDGSDGSSPDNQPLQHGRKEAAHAPKKKRRLRKDPDVDSSFLPDRDRELAEEKERERLKQDWLRKQDAIKNEIVRITYSFWDGTGHRKLINCKKGTTIAHFLTIVQTQVKQLRNTTADSLMFIKEDLIIPHHYSFYDFIVSKARGVRLCTLPALRNNQTVY